jgi:rhodanese-related sulfurtransferase
MKRARDAFAPRLAVTPRVRDRDQRGNGHREGLRACERGLRRAREAFPGDVLGLAFNVDEDEIGVVLLGDYWLLHAGDEVERTGRVMDVAVGDGLLGRVIDPLGRSSGRQGPRAPRARVCPSSAPRPPSWIARRSRCPSSPASRWSMPSSPSGAASASSSWATGRRERPPSRIDTILNQAGENVVCVYCAIGQRASAVAKAVASLRAKGAMDYTVVVVAEGNEHARPHLHRARTPPPASRSTSWRQVATCSSSTTT